VINAVITSATTCEELQSHCATCISNDPSRIRDVAMIEVRISGAGWVGAELGILTSVTRHSNKFSRLHLSSFLHAPSDSSAAPSHPPFAFCIGYSSSPIGRLRYSVAERKPSTPLELAAHFYGCAGGVIGVKHTPSRMPFEQQDPSVRTRTQRHIDIQDLASLNCFIRTADLVAMIQTSPVQLLRS
jgi:hypothetical protein